MPMPISTWICCLLNRVRNMISQTGELYVNRPDTIPAADFVVGDFTTNGAWQDLDLSAIVPQQASAVVLSLVVRDAVAGALTFRRGGANWYALGVDTAALNLDVHAQGIVPLNRSAVPTVQYNGAAMVWTRIELRVVGYFVSL